MASVMHISLDKATHNLDSALEYARDGREVFLDGEGETFRLVRVETETNKVASDSVFGTVRKDLRPLSEVLADPAKRWSTVPVDEKWSSDMESILEENRRYSRDLWQG